MKAAFDNALTSTVPQERSVTAIFCDLFKARLSLLVLLTASVGFYMGSTGGLDGWLFWHVLFGTGLLTAGAAALNQYLERDCDARMNRTARRPLPAGELRPSTVLRVGVLISAVGMLYLTLLVNPLTGALGMVTLAIYLFVYTPLKQRTTLNTLIGAVPGALPPLMGWTAATGELSGGGWALFAILFFWQMPHFMAIAWLYQEDYRKGGFCMLPTQDPTGFRTATTAVRHSMALMGFSLFPFLLRDVSWHYLPVALGLGTAFLVTAIRFSQQLSPARARHLFLASILYLPLLLGALVATRVVDSPSTAAHGVYGAHLTQLQPAQLQPDFNGAIKW